MRHGPVLVALAFAATLAPPCGDGGAGEVRGSDLAAGD